MRHRPGPRKPVWHSVIRLSEGTAQFRNNYGAGLIAKGIRNLMLSSHLYAVWVKPLYYPTVQGISRRRQGRKRGKHTTGETQPCYLEKSRDWRWQNERKAPQQNQQTHSSNRILNVRFTSPSIKFTTNFQLFINSKSCAYGIWAKQKAFFILTETKTVNCCGQAQLPQERPHPAGYGLLQSQSAPVQKQRLYFTFYTFLENLIVNPQSCHISKEKNLQVQWTCILTSPSINLINIYYKEAKHHCNYTTRLNWKSVL